MTYGQKDRTELAAWQAEQERRRIGVDVNSPQRRAARAREAADRYTERWLEPIRAIMARIRLILPR